MENFGKFMAVVLSMTIAPIINGFVLSKLWVWFIVPIFGFSALSIIQCVGLLVVTAFIGSKYNDKASEDFWSTLGKKIVFMFITAGYTLLVGWIVQSLM